MACYVYGQMAAERHLFEGKGSRSIHAFSTGPICVRCGISKGTADREDAEDAARPTPPGRSGTADPEART